RRDKASPCHQERSARLLPPNPQIAYHATNRPCNNFYAARASTTAIYFPSGLTLISAVLRSSAARANQSAAERGNGICPPCAAQNLPALCLALPSCSGQYQALCVTRPQRNLASTLVGFSGLKWSANVRSLTRSHSAGACAMI